MSTGTFDMTDEQTPKRASTTWLGPFVAICLMFLAGGVALGHGFVSGIVFWAVILAALAFTYAPALKSASDDTPGARQKRRSLAIGWALVAVLVIFTTAIVVRFGNRPELMKRGNTPAPASVESTTGTSGAGTQ